MPDAPHYAVFLYDNGCGYIILNDPLCGPHFCIKKSKFLKQWKKNPRDFPDRKIAETNHRWFAAFKPKTDLENDSEKDDQNSLENKCVTSTSFKRMNLCSLI